MEVARHPHRLDRVAAFYASDVVIETFNRGFAGRWHTRIVPDADGPKTSEDYVANLLDLAPNHRMLDFGCGVGVVAASLAQKTGCSVRGLNISAPQLEQARKVAQGAGVADRVEFDLYEGLCFPYPDESFERAVFFESVCHVPDKSALFSELSRVLRPGGVLAGQDWLVTSSDLPQRDYDDFIRPIEASCEVRLHTLAEYTELLQRAGFSNVHAVDAREIYANMAAAFTRPNGVATHVDPADDLATRLSKGNVALSNAFHRGLFTVGFFRAEKSGRTRSSGRVRADGTDHETGAIDCFSAPKNVEVIERHARSFRVGESPELAALVDLAGAARSATSEASCKVEGAECHSARFNLFFHGDPGEAYFRVRAFLATLGPRLRTDATDEFVGEDFDFRRVQKIVTGLDVRDSPAASRAKIWFMLRDYPEKVELALRLGKDDGRVRSVIVHFPFLVGFDLHFDGTSRIKLYPDVRPEELADRRIQAALGTDAIAAMAECSWTHLYFTSPDAPPILQLHPRDPDAFVERYLVPELARPVHAHYAGADLLDMVVSIDSASIGKGRAERFGLYYMPRGNAPAAPRGAGG